MKSCLGISASDLGSLLSCFEEVQPLIEKEMSLKQDLTVCDSLNKKVCEDQIGSHLGNVIGKEDCGQDITINKCQSNAAIAQTLGGKSDLLCQQLYFIKNSPHHKLNKEEKHGQNNMDDLSDSSWTDDSSSESSDYQLSANKAITHHHYRGRGCNFGRHKKGGGMAGGPFGRGRSHTITSLENSTACKDGSGTPEFFDKLPNYYTVLSRPAHGIVRNIHLNPSELEFPEAEHQSSYENLLLDKIPAYQSCFTNSIKYDEKFDEVKFSLPITEDENPSVSRQRELLRSEGRKRCCRAKHKDVNARKVRSRSRGRSRGRSRSRGRTSAMKTVYKKKSTSVREHSGKRNDNLDKEHETAERDLGPKSRSLERKIVYVGRIPRGFSRKELMDLFQQFGGIAECSVHFRDSGDNYGFVTFENYEGSRRAVENGNRLPGCEHWDICFGGRRRFCKADYTDLDGNMQVTEEYIAGVMRTSKSFDELLRDTVRSRR